jgi:hypothetical protein
MEGRKDAKKERASMSRKEALQGRKARKNAKEGRKEGKRKERRTEERKEGRKKGGKDRRIKGVVSQPEAFSA